MKKIVLSLTLVLTAMLAFPVLSYAQDISDDDGEPIIVIDQSLNGNGPGRDFVSVPIMATLYRSLLCISIEFTRDIGEVTISLNNLTTGSFTSTVVNSQNGFAIIPLPASPGLWQITFQPEGGGVIYSGTFIL